jgi:phage replication O-like protein O
METPQLEDGYTRIANEILEALARAEFSGRERRVLDVIFRMTYGYRRKEARIKNRVFVEMTGITRAHACHVLAHLEAKCPVLVSHLCNPVIFLF